MATRVRIVAPGLLALLVAFWPLLTARGFDSADHLDFYLRTAEYSTEIGAGHWPQLLPGAVGGGGHALPRFYPPVAHLAATATNAMAQDPVLASHLATMLALVLSVVGVSILVFEVSSSGIAAAVAGICYAVLPYRGQQVFIRGAFAEAWLLACLPFVLLGLVRWSRSGRLPGWWPLTVAAALLSHTATSLWALPAIGIVVIMAGPPRDRRAWGALALHLVLAASMAAALLLPAAWYLDSVRAGDPALMGATAAALASNTGGWQRDALAGGVALLLVAIGAVTLRRAPGTGSTGDRVGGSAVVGAGVLLGLTVAPVVVWMLVPQPWRYIQFPWRLVGPAMFLLAVGVGLMTPRLRTRTSRIALGVALTAITAGSVVEFRRDAIVREGLTWPAIRDSTGAPYGDRGLTLGGDYLPIESDPATLGRRIAATSDRLAGSGALSQRGRNGSLTLRLEPSLPARSIPLPLVAYDMWQARDQGGNELELVSVEGQWHVEVPAGTTFVEVRRRIPPVVVVGMILGVLGLLGTAWNAWVSAHRES